MAFGIRSRLGTSLIAASLMLLPVTLVDAGPALAENNNDGPVFGFQKRKKKLPAAAQALPQAVIAGKATTDTEVVAEKNISPMLTVESAQLLQAAIDRYQQIQSEGGFPKVPKGTYKKGAESKGVAFLNKRLFLEGYLRKEATEGEFASRVTSATVDAVSRFQRNMGLAATGLVDGPTLAALNVPVSDRIRTMQANIARLELYSQDLGDRYLVVNVPGQQIETVDGGRVYSRHNAIVGRPERPTPVVMTSLSDINFNPYWNTPPSIIERDLIPKMVSGTKILDEMNIKVFKGFGGPEIDPDTVNWRTAVADDYHFRQEPGPHSAMATAKINFPSPFGIYLHDTPERHLFNSGSRLYSSGCVRVEQIDVLLNWILNGQEGIGSAEISALAETLERKDVKLAAAPQLRVAYLTAWPVGNSVAFRQDVYGLDGTGFTVGQPLPTGELSEDGQRFVLKPIPRKPGAVDADEAEGFGLFGTRIGKSSKRKPTNALFSSADDRVGPSIAAKPKKLPFGFKNDSDVASGSAVVKPGTRKVKASNKDAPGLFDWAAYRKGQKTGGKKVSAVPDKKSKKKVTTKKAETEVAAAVPKDNAALAKKKLVTDKVTDKAATKKLENVPTKKVAAADPKAVKKTAPEVVAKKVVAADPAKVPETAAKKKPVTETAKKVADNCKPDAAGKLPKGCKPAPAKKP